MHSTLPIATLALLSTHVLASPSQPPTIPTSSSWPNSPCPWTHAPALTHDEVVANYLALWAGDLSYTNKTVVPSFSLWQDRYPDGTQNGSIALPINSAYAMQQFVAQAREGFEHYEFVDQFHFGVGNMLVMRWTLNGTFGGSKYASLPKGSHVAYNGTDIALLDPCTGKMQQILSAQDSITYNHVIGQPIGSV